MRVKRKSAAQNINIQLKTYFIASMLISGRASVDSSLTLLISMQIFILLIFLCLSFLSYLYVWAFLEWWIILPNAMLSKCLIGADFSGHIEKFVSKVNTNAKGKKYSGVNLLRSTDWTLTGESLHLMCLKELCIFLNLNHIQINRQHFHYHFFSLQFT